MEKPTHLMNQNDLRSFCQYCGSDLTNEEWKSHHMGEIFYKVCDCPECSRKSHINIKDFIGSGHDSWDSRMTWKEGIKATKTKVKLSSLEKKLNVVVSKSKYHL